MRRPVRVVLADDHYAFVEGLLRSGKAPAPKTASPETEPKPAATGTHH